uniref:Tetrahydrofolate dehydrogenase/cyclohydrolase NAD(P)-binding domain-containing protein n=1 Tax=Lactuca sativa TaxID=4236 RepID=A0A9R1XDS8_LACSA|nr:hypothetical protein LSAT_V11C400220190 [Lactuca sativa]
MKNSINKVPGLGVILVGKRKASLTFVCIKKKACEQVEIASVVTELPEDVQKAKCGWFSSCEHGNLAMRGREPLFIPCASLGCIGVLNQCSVENLGKKAVVIGRSMIGLPTSLLLQVLILFVSKLSCFNVIIRLNHMSFYIQRHHATISVVHSFTKNPEEITCEADILVSDVGVPNLIRSHWLKPGVVVIDMGSMLV